MQVYDCHRKRMACVSLYGLSLELIYISRDIFLAYLLRIAYLDLDIAC